MLKPNRIAYGVRVRLNEQFQVKCLGDDYLKMEKVLWVTDTQAANDTKGHYVHISGGSMTGGGYAYLNELELEPDPEFKVPESPLYYFEGEKIIDIPQKTNG